MHVMGNALNVLMYIYIKTLICLILQALRFLWLSDFFVKLRLINLKYSRLVFFYITVSKEWRCEGFGVCLGAAHSPGYKNVVQTGHPDRLSCQTVTSKAGTSTSMFPRPSLIPSL